jgi:hypothetical protein
MCVAEDVVCSVSAVAWCACMQSDLELVREAGRGNVNITVGSALDIFGGDLPYYDVLQWHRAQQQQS